MIINDKISKKNRINLYKTSITFSTLNTIKITFNPILWDFKVHSPLNKFQSWWPMLTKTCDVGTAVFDFTVSFNCSSCASNCFIIISTSWAQVIISDCEDNIISMNILLHNYVCLKPYLLPTSPEGELSEGKDSALWGILNTKNSANIWIGPQKCLLDTWALWTTMAIIFLKCIQVLFDIQHNCISKQWILWHISPTINIYKYKKR